MTRTNGHPARSLAALAAALMAAGTAQADADPYTFGASAGYGRDSNVFRAPDATADTYRTLGLSAAVDQPIGRQRVYADAKVRDVKFDEQSALDYVGWGVRAGLDWSTIGNVSGVLRLDSARSRASATLDNRDLRVPNLETSRQLSARVRWGGPSIFVLDGGWTGRKLDYSAPEYAVAEVKQDAVDIGLRWQPSSALQAGIGVRRTEGEYPEGATRFTRNDLDLNLRWVPTGHSSVLARLSFGKQDSAGATSGRDFDGTTGAVTWDWRPTGKLAFLTTLSRDTGLESSFIRFEDRADTRQVGDFSRLTTALHLTGTWQATAKIGVRALLRQERRDLSDNGPLAFGGAARSGRDTLSVMQLGVSWTPTRVVTLGCQVGRERRSESGGLVSPFTANLASCSAQISLST